MSARVMTREDRAAAQYQERLARVRGMVERLVVALDEHRDRQAVEPWDWGFGGDLGRLEDVLWSALHAVGDAEAVRREEGGR